MRGIAINMGKTSKASTEFSRIIPNIHRPKEDKMVLLLFIAEFITLLTHYYGNIDS